MKAILYPFMVLAACGLALSMAAHGLALAGAAIPGGNLVWTLHTGIFLVWLPTVLVSIRMTNQASRQNFWKVALAGCPPWMRVGFFVLIGYAILNFIICFESMASRPKQQAVDSTPEAVRGFPGIG